MKHFICIIGLILLFSSCEQLNVVNTLSSETDASETIWLSIKVNNQSGTRASISASNDILFDYNDKVAVVDKNYNYNVFSIKPGSISPDRKSAEIEGTVSSSSETYVVIYPYQAPPSLYNYSYGCIPQIQTATDNTFDPAAVISVGKTNGSSVILENLMSLVKFTIPSDLGYTINEIEFCSHNNEFVSGVFEDVTQLALGTGYISQMYNSATLRGSFKPNTTYYLAVRPQVYYGFTIYMKSTEGFVALTSKLGNVTFEKNRIYNINNSDNNTCFRPNINITVNNGKKYSYVDFGSTVYEGNTINVGKWATTNLGTPNGYAEEIGDYFAWGAISPNYASINHVSSDIVWKDEYPNGYDQWSAPYWNVEPNNDPFSDYYSYTKYNREDGLIHLQPMDDAACQIMGNDWKIPSHEQFENLVNGTSISWAQIKNSQGLIFSKNGDSIFLPITGISGITGEWGEYQINERLDYSEDQVYFEFNQSYYSIYQLRGWHAGNRSFGRNIRAVFIN